VRNAKREKDGEMNERISKHMYNTLKITQVERKREDDSEIKNVDELQNGMLSKPKVVYTWVYSNILFFDHLVLGQDTSSSNDSRAQSRHSPPTVVPTSEKYRPGHRYLIVSAR
jgi:hypothetical protein